MKDFMGEISFSKDNLANSKINACVTPSTVDTGNNKRDEHLKSKDFFLVSVHPKICFKSNSIQEATKGYNLSGNLNILGITQEVTFPFTYTDGVFKGHLELNRLDYKLGKKFPTFIVGKTI